MTATSDVIGFAKRNGSVITSHEAAALGMSRTMLATRVRDGVLVRLANGLYCLPGAATTPDLMLDAACRLYGAVVSHQSAARMHGLKPIRESRPSVTVAHRSTNRLPGVVVHQSTDLLDEHTLTMDRLRVTNVERTVVDLAKVIHPKALERVVDNAILENKVELRRLLGISEALARRGKKGLPRLRAIVEARLDDAPPPESELEAAMLDLIERIGLPQPTRQYRADWLRRSFGRVDFAYIDHRIVVEVDGRRWHSHRDAFEEDRRRDNAAQLAGWVVLRFTWQMVVDDPIEVGSVIRKALASREKVETRG